MPSIHRLIVREPVSNRGMEQTFLDKGMVEPVSDNNASRHNIDQNTDQRVALCKAQINTMLSNGIVRLVPQLAIGNLSSIEAVSANVEELYAEMGEDFINELLTDPEIRSNITKTLNSHGWTWGGRAIARKAFISEMKKNEVTEDQLKIASSCAKVLNFELELDAQLYNQTYHHLFDFIEMLLMEQKI